MTDFTFEWWWMFLALPLPLLIYYLAKPINKKAPIYLPRLPDSSAGAVKPSQTLAKLIIALLWLALLTAAARPMSFGDPVTISPKHRDMMLVVDLSGSMSTEDMLSGDQAIDRLTAVKEVLSRFIKKRVGDRVGLVYFADHAYLQTPLTLDRQSVSEQMSRTVLGLVGSQTAIGEGIGLAVKNFVDSDAPQRVILLLTDGSNNSGVLDPIEAAKIAKKYNSVIYTIGVGAGEVVMNDFFGPRRVNTAADLDEASLQEIAKITGGRYFRAKDLQSLANIYHTINELQPINKATQTWRPEQEWFYLPLAIALLLSLLFVIIRKEHV